MQRRVFLLTLLSAPALAQVRPLPEAPDAAPRDDSRFSAALLEGMAQGEALARERLSRFPRLRALHRQVPRPGWNAVEAYYLRVLLAEWRWRDAGITQPAGRAPHLPPQGWTDGQHVVALVGAHPTRQENGLLPFTLLTTLPG